jgi:hypothetical protein
MLLCRNHNSSRHGVLFPIHVCICCRIVSSNSTCSLQESAGHLRHRRRTCVGFLHRPRVTGFQWQGMGLNICEGLVGDNIPHKIGKITVFKAFSFG